MDAAKENPPDEFVIGRAFHFNARCQAPLQSEASASFNVLLGRIAADVLASLGK